MAESTGRIEKGGGGCGVTGCLYAAVVLFALLMVGMLVIVIIRFSDPPEPQTVPQPRPVGWYAPEDVDVDAKAPRASFETADVVHG
jgi:hypothetical protein